MKDHPERAVIETLQGALATGQLPEAAQNYANHLVSRLSSPVRVSVLGLPGSGKSHLINMLVGEVVIPEGQVLPTTEVVYGDDPKLTVTQNDGEVRELALDALNTISASESAFLRLETPSVSLKRISLLEVVTDGSAGELKLAVDWAVKRTDIALWCSQEFGASERQLWDRVPDALKDHAFLALTKADILSAERQLASRISSLEAVVAEEFHSLFAVATKQAIKAQASDDEQVLHASGGGAVIAEVMRHAERGRRADFDSAHLFLARYKLENVAPVAAEEKAPEKEDVKDVPKRGEDAVEAAPAPETADVLAFAKASRPALFADAIRFVKRRAEGMGEPDPDDLGPVIEQCISMVDYLSDMFSQDDDGCDAVDEVLDDLAEANDMLVLMQIEADAASAADAVTLVLQLEREMEARIAA